MSTPGQRLDGMSFRPSVIAVVAGLALGVMLSTAGPALATRNSSGTYSLPGGNPVVSGTTISSSWANNTLADIATEMTSSLDRQGRGGMLAPLKLINGSGSAPSVSWTSDPDSGLYRAGAGDIRMQTDSNQIQRWESGGTSIVGTLTCETTATFEGATTFEGTATAVNLLSAAAGGPGFALKPGTADHTYMEFYADTAAPNTRSGYLGYASAGQTELTIANQMTGGNLRLVTPANILADSPLVMNFVNPVPTSAYTNAVTPKNIVKAWATLTTTGGGSTAVTITNGFNIASASADGDSVNITFASAFTNDSYAVFTNGRFNLGCYGYPVTATTMSVECFTNTPSVGALFNFQTGGLKIINILAIGAQ